MPAQSNNQQQQQGGENSLDFLWLIVIVLAAVIFTWYFGKDYISAFIYKIRFYEIAAIQYAFSAWDYLAHKLSFLSLPVPNLKTINQWQAMISANKLGANLNDLQKVSTEVGSYLRYPMILVLSLLAFFVYSKNVGLKFKNYFSMKRFRNLEMENWPQITPVAKLNLIKQDINEGPWAMARTPMQFCKKYHIIDEVNKDGQIVAELRKAEAYNVFVMQLGPFWSNPEKLPIHIKALFGAFAACSQRDRDSANQLLLQISKSADSGKLNFTGAKKLFAKHFNAKEVQKVIYRHAYVITMMASMVELARTDGVLGSAEFLWLKPVDRRLWYMLNSVGRQTAVPEVSGAFAHWLAECKLHRALRVPMVDEAVKGLEAALTEIIYEPDEE